MLARLLGPDAKGRFTLVLLLSQLAAVVVGWGMDAALGVVAGRSTGDARLGFANAVIWSAVVGGLAVVVACWLYGLPTDVRPRGPLTSLIPNLSAAQFLYAALAIPGELFFALGLFALLGRRRVAAYNAIRLLRRATLLVLVVGAAAVARLSLDVAVVCNLVALGLTAAAIAFAAHRDGIAGLRPSAPLLAEELRFGTQVLPGAIAERLQLRSDAFLLNLLVGVRATGVYSVTAGLAETLWYIPNALGTVMFSRAVDPGEDAAGHRRGARPDHRGDHPGARRPGVRPRARGSSSSSTAPPSRRPASRCAGSCRGSWPTASSRSCRGTSRARDGPARRPRSC